MFARGCNLIALLTKWYKMHVHDKGKPAARRGRKATGLHREVAGPPKGALIWTSPYVL